MNTREERKGERGVVLASIKNALLREEGWFADLGERENFYFMLRRIIPLMLDQPFGPIMTLADQFPEIDKPVRQEIAKQYNTEVRARISRFSYAKEEAAYLLCILGLWLEKQLHEPHQLEPINVSAYESVLRKIEAVKPEFVFRGVTLNTV